MKEFKEFKLKVPVNKVGLLEGLLRQGLFLEDCELSPYPGSEIITSRKTTNSDYWTIEDKKGTLELYKGLLKPAPQAKHVQNYLEGKSPKPISFPEISRLGKALLDNKHPQENEILKFLRESFRNKFILTDSGVLYKPGRKKDIVMHDVGLLSEYTKKVNFVGSDRYVEKDDELALKCSTELNSLKEIKEVFEFITGINGLYLWRLDSKPDQEDYCVAGFGAGPGRVGLYFCGVPFLSNPSVGVRSEKNLGDKK